MTDGMRLEILLRHSRGESMNSIAKSLGIWPHSVRYQIRREEHRRRERDLRRLAGARTYRCGRCGELGHNLNACPELGRG